MVRSILAYRFKSDVEGRQRAEKRPLEFIKRLGPPNLQLNLSSDHVNEHQYRKRIELFLAAIVAVFIQAGLIALVAATVLYPPLRKRIGFEPKIYGLPCYIGGSMLLSLGVGVCSYAVERNTTELAWTIPKDNEDRHSYPNLIFLQKHQTVNDQAFNAYTMLAGPKRRIIASTRNRGGNSAVLSTDKRVSSLST